ncbi:MAG TPA: GNAT family N-acetyltransferase [Gemmatimonadaceae bacterium]|nr:GNAT family N-acetyltransferase [Gemmatimonadaceae bacterium]
MKIPEQLQTPRLLLRRWRTTDAAALGPILEANVAHLARWIPARIAMPAAAAELVGRLESFAAAFDAGREWRYALVASDASRLLGEVSLFPRGQAGRVPFDSEDADHIEIGYWLRHDTTGQGFATEAARAAMDLALSLPGMSRVTIHCDEQNASSAAVPRRLGFEHVATIEEPAHSGLSAARLQIWEYTRP